MNSRNGTFSTDENGDGKFQLRRVSDFVAGFAAASPDAEALVAGEQRITYAQLQARVDALARALLASGVKKGDTVATLITPHPDFVVAFLATACIGGVWLGLNPRYQTEEIKYVVSDAKPVVLLARTRVSDRDYFKEIAVMTAAAPSIQHVIALNDGPQPPGSLPYHEFMERGQSITSARLEDVRENCGGRDPCLLVYTSGSTGKPKGALLHHDGIVAFCQAQNNAWPVPRQRVLNYFPINHVGSVIDVSCPTLACGGCIVFMEKFEPGESMALIEHERISVWLSVPSTFQMQLALPNFESYDLSSVRLIVWEGAAMPRDAIRRLREICPNLASNYGMTETTSAVTIIHPTDDIELLADTVGVPFEGVEVRLIGEDGNVVAPGKTGEIQARSRYNMLGYLNRASETRETLLTGGWLRTGDLAIEREDGYLKLVGRLKEMFKSGGYNVYPREVENAIESHPNVVTVAVVSRPDDIWQEVGIAYITLRRAMELDDIRDHCGKLLANYKIPKAFVVCEALPLLPIGKVDKVALREHASKGTAEPPNF